MTAKMYMERYQKERKKVKWQELLVFLLAGSVLLTGCSGRRDSGESGAEWNFQANQEENSDGRSAGTRQQSDAEDGTAQPEYAAADGADSLSGTFAAGAAPADSNVLGGAGAASADTNVLGGAGAAPADSNGTDGAGTASADTGVPDGAGAASPGNGVSDPAVQPSAPGYVYICGAVVSPGVYEISEGMRVFEVIAQAGGLTEQADAEWINQAETVFDGQKLQIYTKEETAAFREAGLSAPGQEMTAGAGGTAPGTAAANGTAAQGAAGDDKVNINTADKDLLMTLPGIGESKAEAILQYRQEHGNFGSIEDICQISGIKEAVFSKIKDRITV